MTELDIIFLLTDVQGYLMTFTCILCFIFFSRLDPALRILSYYLFFLLIIQYVITLLAAQSANNLANTHIIALGEFIFLSLYFRELLKHQSFIKKYFRTFLGIIGAAIIANTLFLEKIDTYNTNAKVLVLFVIVYLATAFFLDRSKRLMEVGVQERAVRIINAAILLYYSGSFFVYLFYKFTTNNEVFFSLKVMIFNAVLYLIFTILILIAIIMVIFPKKKVGSN